MTHKRQKQGSTKALYDNCHASSNLKSTLIYKSVNPNGGSLHQTFHDLYTLNTNNSSMNVKFDIWEIDVFSGFQVTRIIKGFFGLEILNFRIFSGWKFWQVFFSVPWLSRDFLGYSKQSEDLWSDSSNISRLCSSANKFFSEIQHEILGGLNFGPGILGFLWSPRDFWGIWFLPPFDHPCRLKPGVPHLGVQNDRKADRLSDPPDIFLPVKSRILWDFP